MASGLNRLRDPQFLVWRMPWLVVSLLLGLAAIFGAVLQPPAPDPFTLTGTSPLTWFRHPIERNPYLRLPSTSGELNSVALSPDGRTGLAVGNGGTILQTTDGGETWTARASGTSVALTAVAISADGRTGLAVGNGGTILQTADGGETWTARASGTSVALTAVAIRAHSVLMEQFWHSGCGTSSFP